MTNATGWESIAERSLIFGQGPGADVVVNDEYASARHCRITQRGNRCYVEDLGSTNGTWVVRRFGKHMVYGPTLLQPGDKVVIGRTELPWEVDR